MISKGLEPRQGKPTQTSRDDESLLPMNEGPPNNVNLLAKIQNFLICYLGGIFIIRRKGLVTVGANSGWLLWNIGFCTTSPLYPDPNGPKGLDMEYVAFLWQES